MKTWNVWVRGLCLGQVYEDDEDSARGAALSKFGLHEEDMAEMTREKIASLVPHRIFPDDDFSVSLK